MKLNINRKELLSAGLLVLIGTATIIGSFNYEMGTLARMRSGYFPFILGVALIIVGLLVLTSTAVIDDEEDTSVAKEIPEYRAWACVIAGMIIFIVVGKYGGLVPATFLSVTVSALADRSNSPKTALLLAAAMTVVAVGVFYYGLQLQFPLFRWG